MTIESKTVKVEKINEEENFLIFFKICLETNLLLFFMFLFSIVLISF